MNNLENKKFERLTVIRLSGKTNKCGHLIWLCLCDCGNYTEVSSSKLKRGHTRSCGCLQKEIAKKTFFKHGGKGTRLFKLWIGIKQRCYNSKMTGYEYYGGRGIKVCDEWKDNFSAFRFWAILNGYQYGLTIDRINNDGNYEPENCQWLTRSENTKKQRRLECQ